MQLAESGPRTHAGPEFERDCGVSLLLPLCCFALGVVSDFQAVCDCWRVWHTLRAFAATASVQMISGVKACSQQTQHTLCCQQHTQDVLTDANSTQEAQLPGQHCMKEGGRWVSAGRGVT